ncbi:hypothetical protein F3Y22_tig00110833pilonHSYRG00188 [Hibiscus syriacus]|uniref:Uncharacterized protein n=1 Tax=Hibiscus syriacus TaxID=106335 RepID=A0A6A2ZNN6_HIBSY|nr:hypothetical protein F3Y22_tig00110833pilonHSYRG00188 [Hibiscus syriacus]
MNLATNQSRNTAELVLELVLGDLTNYLRLSGARSWLQGGLDGAQDVSSRFAHLAAHLIECILATARMMRFNADLISSAVPGADFTKTSSWFQGGSVTQQVDELCDHFETCCYESHLAYAETLQFTIGLISIIFPGLDVPDEDLVDRRTWPPELSTDDAQAIPSCRTELNIAATYAKQQPPPGEVYFQCKLLKALLHVYACFSTVFKKHRSKLFCKCNAFFS